MIQLYKHYSMLDQAWDYPNFTPKEVSCKHCGELYYDDVAMSKLQGLRDMWGKPMVITSGHRCKVHNKNVGGVSSSQHLRIAFDCAVPKAEQDKFVTLAQRCGFTGIGRYPDKGFVHLDTGPARTWKG